jgi:hypothetical protein
MFFIKKKIKLKVNNHLELSDTIFDKTNEYVNEIFTPGDDIDVTNYFEIATNSNVKYLIRYYEVLNKVVNSKIQVSNNDINKYLDYMRDNINLDYCALLKIDKNLKSKYNTENKAFNKTFNIVNQKNQKETIKQKEFNIPR